MHTFSQSSDHISSLLETESQSVKRKRVEWSGGREEGARDNVESASILSSYIIMSKRETLFSKKTRTMIMNVCGPIATIHYGV